MRMDMKLNRIGTISEKTNKAIKLIIIYRV